MNMKHPVSLVLLACLATPCLAQDKSPEGKPVPTAAVKTSPKNAKTEMKGINRSVRAIGKFLKDPSGAAPMDQVAELQQLAMEAKFHTPTLAAKQPDGKREEFLKAYRKKMNELIRGALDLEEAMEAKDWEKAKQTLATLESAKEQGHKEFKPRRARGRGRGR